jgi:hypothetical protein
MTRFVLIAGLGLLAVAGRASAQFGPTQLNNPYVRPAISPYLNLNQGGGVGNLANNYYNLVKPQINTRRELQSLQQQVQQQQLAPQLGTNLTEDDGLMATYAVTGHPSQFMNTSHYFGQTGTGVRPNQPIANQTLIRR